MRCLENGIAGKGAFLAYNATHNCNLLLLLLWLPLLQSAPGAAEGDPTQEPTGLPLTTLQRVGNAICKVPEGFNCHPDVSVHQMFRV
jgi:hypothetical protein